MVRMKVGFVRHVKSSKRFYCLSFNFKKTCTLKVKLQALLPLKALFGSKFTGRVGLYVFNNLITVKVITEMVNRKQDFSLNVHFLFQCHVGFTMAPPL